MTARRLLAALAAIATVTTGGLSAVPAAADAVDEFTYSNPNGQTVVLSSGDANPLVQQDGKLVVVDGAKVTAKLSGLTNSQQNTATAPSGFYLLTAVDKGAGVVASPAIGGADTTGASGASQWITNHPYPGTPAVPIAADLTATASIKVSSADEFTDCKTVATGCVIYLRVDHRATGNRSFDVRVPIAFAGTAPVVTTHPADATVAAGQAATFSATASGASAVAWETRAPGGAWESLPGATTSTLQLPAVEIASSGRQYRAVFTNATGQTSSNPATLTVQQVWTPRIEVSKTSGVNRDGELITVKGSGFDPAANTSLRVPVTPGQPAGVYVVFGSFADEWQPSKGATAAARTLIDTKWALPQASYDQVVRDFPAQAPRLVPLAADGTFELKVNAKVIADNPRNYGVYTYPGGGAVNAAHELAVPVAFVDGGPDPEEPVTNALDWGLKASFRQYIEGNIAHGSITMRPPARRSTDGAFRFPEGSGTAGAGRVQVAFAGGVYFKGHESQPGNPLLEVEVSQVRVKIDGNAGKVVADVASKSLETGQTATYDDVELADIDLSAKPLVLKDGVARVTGAPTKLTAAGVPAFANFYEAGAAMDPITFSVEVDDEPAPGWNPKLELLGADGKPLGVVAAAGTTRVTVKGTGFDPAANLSTRPPVTPGLPAGVYVVFGTFDPVWRPSANAAPSSRRVIDQKWALPDSSRPGQPNPAYVTLKADGSFETTLDLRVPADATGTFGIATYAAGGAAPNASQELLKPVVFGNTGTPKLVVDPVTGLADGQLVTVRGSGFAPKRALYVAQTPAGVSGTTHPSPFSGAQRVETTAEGTFEASVPVLATFRNADVDCVKVVCHIASFHSPVPADNALLDLAKDRSQDVFRAITFKQPGPQPVVPVVTTQPKAVSVVAGSSVSFVAAASGTPAPTVQWERSNDQGKTWQPVASPSALTSALKLTVVAGDNGARFRAVFSNSAGSAVSSAAGLTVTVPPSAMVNPSTVVQGKQIVVEGKGMPVGQRVKAIVDPRKPAVHTFANGKGQGVEIASVTGVAVAGGKLVVPDGATVTVKVTGLANSKANTAVAPSGFYLLTAFDNGPGQQASPAIGGVDMSGESGQSQWITNFPYPGSEDVVVPIRTDLSALASIKVSSADEFNDCAKAPHGCVLYVRTDHRSTGNRAFDVRVPLQFAKPGAAAALGTSVGEQTVGADGTVRLTWSVPAGFAVGKHAVALTGSAGTIAAASFTVKAKPAGQPDPDGNGSDGSNGSNGSDGSDGIDGADGVGKQVKPASSLADTGGTSTGPLVAGAVLLVAGVSLLLLTRRRRQLAMTEDGPTA